MGEHVGNVECVACIRHDNVAGVGFDDAAQHALVAQGDDDAPNDVKQERLRGYFAALIGVGVAVKLRPAPRAPALVARLRASFLPALVVIASDVTSEYRQGHAVCIRIRSIGIMIRAVREGAGIFVDLWPAVVWVVRGILVKRLQPHGHIFQTSAGACDGPRSVVISLHFLVCHGVPGLPQRELVDVLVAACGLPK